MELKERHGCFIGWLLASTIIGILKVLIIIFKPDTYLKTLPTSLSEDFATISLILNTVAVVFILVLYRLKKWAFWGILIISLISNIIALYAGYPIWKVCISSLWIVILYLVMQLKKNKISAWQDLH